MPDCGLRPGPKKFSSFDPQANALLAKMTLDEKVGQMTQPDRRYLESDADIAKYYLGSVLSGGGSAPKEGNSLEAWTNMVDRYMKRSLKRAWRFRCSTAWTRCTGTTTFWRGDFSAQHRAGLRRAIRR